MFLLMLFLSPLDEARTLFEEGVRLRQSRQRFRAPLREAAELIEAELAQRPSPSLHRALGNARLWGDDLPRAVLAYRLGVRRYPDDAALRRCLDEARRLVPNNRPPPEERRWLPPAWVVALAWAGACAALVRWRMIRTRGWLLLGVVLLVVSLIGIGLHVKTGARPIAVLAEDRPLRKGDNELFAARLDLPRGTELEIVARRGNWLLVQSASGAGWVPASAVVE